MGVVRPRRGGDPAGRVRLAAPGPVRHGGSMSNHTYRVTEIVGSSPQSVDEAIRNGIARAAQTLRNLDWFEVTQIRGQLAEGGVAHYQVGLKVGFRLEDT
ncbi:hypothetical protein GCM10010218_07950 [Streptomyces mashuensis]|uniref:Dodecin domain-containing protein n=2 Tax=Streptomyces mashuensis TaxID=33904 RepID=A0A919EA43_9ACTN|nr:hypothetical protein GCM10010218_07950 [Streptomyces mashuensis]